MDVPKTPFLQRLQVYAIAGAVWAVFRAGKTHVS